MIDVQASARPRPARRRRSPPSTRRSSFFPVARFPAEVPLEVTVGAIKSNPNDDLL